jgi:prephenate dehydrogenase
MKTQPWVTFSLVLLSRQAHSATVNKLTNRNVQDATKAYEQTLPSTQRSASTAQLWAHICNDNQTRLTQSIMNRAKNTATMHGKIRAKQSKKWLMAIQESAALLRTRRPGAGTNAT